MNSLEAPYFVPAGNLAGVNGKYGQLVAQVLESGNLIGGKYVHTLESKLTRYLNSKYVFTVASGMDALILSLTSLGLPENSPVLVADNGGGYASLAVLSSKLKPIFCDVSEDNYLVNTKTLSKFEGNAKAIIVTHLYGQMADMAAISSWAKDRGIFIIEDCAQSFGAVQNGKHAGTIGDLGAYSFYPTKNLGGIGDGGAICTDNELMAAQISALRQYGWLNKYDISIENARNSRMDAINAAVLTDKLSEIDLQNARRREILSRYLRASEGIGFFPYKQINADNVAHLAVGISKTPEKMIEYFADKGIELTRHYPLQDSQQLGLNQNGSTLNTDTAKWLCESVVSLPIYPWLSDEQVSHVCNSLVEWGKSDFK